MFKSYLTNDNLILLPPIWENWLTRMILWGLLTASWKKSI